MDRATLSKPSPSTAPNIVGVSQSFINRLFPPPRAFAFRLWDGAVLPAQGEPKFTVVLNSPYSLRRMMRLPLELGLGEAYINGDYDIEGDFVAAVGLFKYLASLRLPTFLALVRDWLALPDLPNGEAHHNGRAPAVLSGALHSKARDRAAVQYHYDLGNDFYQLWLDKRMIYSCAYFPTGAEDLDTAQERKLDHICRKLRLHPGEHLLDIGCGWGGLVIYAAQHYGVTALGVTLSEQQHRLANQRIAEAGLSEQVSVKLLDYRDLRDDTFDKIVSIGMFEHVGRSHMPEYFTHAYRLLKPGGLFLNHGISAHPVEGEWYSHSLAGRFVKRFVIGPSTFANRYIFPDGELVPVSAVNMMAEQAGFEVRDVENLREHYALTLRNWLTRFENRRDEALRLTSPKTCRVWTLYLNTAVAGFELGTINVNQTLLAKMNEGRSSVPLSRADIYAPTSMASIV